MTITYGAMFAGYGGLEMGVQSVFGGETRWHAEFEAAPSKILAHHHPDVPNLGDVTKIDWRAVEPVDVITGGSPCQDLSHAGKRKGMTDGTRSNLWAEMREAVAVIRPRLVVWENVRGALSATATSDVEREPGLLGVGQGRPALRALGRVLGDLAELGYDARWYGLRAADVGGAHGRFRVFLFATPADTNGAGWGEHGGAFAVRPEHAAAERAGAEAGSVGLHGVDPDGERALVGVDLLESGVHGVNEVGGQAFDGCSDRDFHAGDVSDLARNVNGHPLTLLPTPRATDGTKGGPNQRGSSGDLMLPSAVQDWREYEPAIRRCERAWGRPAPAPTEPGKNGKPRLSPKFCEWLMGLPEGHVTDVPDVSRNDQLKALGNGVVPQQAAAATRAFIHDVRTEAA